MTLYKYNDIFYYINLISKQNNMQEEVNIRIVVDRVNGSFYIIDNSEAIKLTEFIGVLKHIQKDVCSENNQLKFKID